MLKIVIVLVVAVSSLVACDNNPNSITRNIKGTVINVVAPEKFVPICERSIAVWGSVSRSLSDKVHVVACFIEQGDWKEPSELSAHDLQPLLTVGIPKNMIEKSWLINDYSAMLSEIKRPDDAASIFLDEETTFCQSGRIIKKIGVQNVTEEIDTVVVTCSTLVKDKYLLLVLENEITNESDIVSIQQLAKDWVALMQDKN